MKKKKILNVTRDLIMPEQRQAGVFEPMPADKNAFINLLTINSFPKETEQQSVIQERVNEIVDIILLEYPDAEGVLIGDVPYMCQPLAQELKSKLGNEFEVVYSFKEVHTIYEDGKGLIHTGFIRDWTTYQTNQTQNNEAIETPKSLTANG